MGFFLYQVGQFLARKLPLEISYKLAIVVSDLHYAFARQDRIAVLANLKAIFPLKPDAQLKKIRLRVFRNFAKYLVDFFRFSLMDKEYVQTHTHVENIHYFDQALAKNKGIVVLSAHLGNWELGAVVIGLLGYPFWVVALTHKDKRVNDFFNSQRKSKGVGVIPLERAVRQCFSLLKDRQMVTLVGDKDFSGTGLQVDFFGRPTVLPHGPAAFALRTGAIIVPGFMIRNPDDTCTLRIEKPIEIEASKNSAKPADWEVKSVIDKYKVVMEEYIRKYPDQWYMFRKFWIEDKR